MTMREAILAEIERWQKGWRQMQLFGWVTLEETVYYVRMGVHKSARRLRPVVLAALSWLLFSAGVVLLTAPYGASPVWIAIRATAIGADLLVVLVQARGAWRRQRRRESHPLWRW